MAALRGDGAGEAKALLSARAVRERAHAMLELGLEGRLAHFAVDPGRLAAATAFVIATTRSRFADLAVPFHARWRQFCAGARDRWGALVDGAGFTDPAARARAAFDLAIVSVLIDAGAGPDWRYREAASGATFARSEGLAVASLAMFAGGMFSAVPGAPLRADAARLSALSDEELARGFQVSADNPLVGLGGRAALLRRLGETVAAQPRVFGSEDEARPGGLFDLLAAKARGPIPAPRILEAVLSHFGPIWPGRLALGGVPLGDTWAYPGPVGARATRGLVPFHKLSQWLTYSLIEPVQQAGLVVCDIDGLTGLPEYRNGGLLIDTGVLALKDPAAAEAAHEVGSPLVVEWRALTVALLDRIAEEMRRQLGLDAERLPLARVLEGGAWEAGRRMARMKRPGGGPPLTVISDGTVF